MFCLYLWPFIIGFLWFTFGSCFLGVYCVFFSGCRVMFCFFVFVVVCTFCKDFMIFLIAIFIVLGDVRDVVFLAFPAGCLRVLNVLVRFPIYLCVASQLTGLLYS